MTLLILGAGQYGQATKELAETVGLYDTILFLDDNSPLAVGAFDDIDKIGHDAAIVALGNPSLRERLLDRIKKPATLIHPRATVMPSAEIAPGSIIEAGAVISSHAAVGRGTIVMANAVIGHDAVIGEFCQLKYGCTVAERSVVPKGSKLDCNTVFFEIK